MATPNPPPYVKAAAVRVRVRVCAHGRRMLSRLNLAGRKTYAHTQHRRAPHTGTGPPRPRANSCSQAQRRTRAASSDERTGALPPSPPSANSKDNLQFPLLTTAHRLDTAAPRTSFTGAPQRLEGGQID